DAAAGAHAMHQSGLAHGSIDGRSVLLADRGGVLAPPPLDLPLGVAARFTTGAVLETVDPDLICGELPSRCSDIWSLGATAHVALGGAPLYEGVREDEPVTAVQRVLFAR